MASQELTAIEATLNQEKLPVPRMLAAIIAVVAIVISIYFVFTGYFMPVQPRAQMLICLTLIMVLGFLLFPLGRKSWRDKLNWFFIIDVFCILFVIVNALYIFLNYNAYELRIADMLVTSTDRAFGLILILLILELTRRTLGWPLVILCGVFLIDCLVSEHLPGILFAPAVSLTRMIDIISMQPFGIFGTPMGVMAGYLIIFFVFVALLIRTGAAKLFLDMAVAIAGRYSGGPAKVAVIASSFMATMTGSSIANVATTGSFTIPLMKDTGYKPHFAGAVEAVASTGGQLMPPVMGVTAFIMAAMMGVDYIVICLAALIPIILYYISVFMMVHFEAKKTGLSGLPPSEIPPLRSAMSRGWPILVPLVVLFVLLGMRIGVAMAGVYAIVTLFIVTMLKKETRLQPKTLLMALEDGARMAVPIGIACACLGVLIGCFYVSGLGDQLAASIVTFSQGKLWIALIIAAVVCILLGMAVPTPVVYITAYVIIIPALIDMGASPLAANFFALYYGVISSITPPVCLAAFAAAGIAGSGMMKTGFTAAMIGIAAYIVPFMFVFSPAMLMEGPITESIISFITGALGVLVLAAAVEGWFLRKANWPERLLLIGGCIGLIIPGLVPTLAGIGCVGLVTFLQKKMPYNEPLGNIPGLVLRGRQEKGEKSTKEADDNKNKWH